VDARGKRGHDAWKNREGVMAKAKRKAKASKAKAKSKLKAKAKKQKVVKAAKRAKRPPQKFTVSHHREEDFDAGLRAYSAYRDLGLAPATGGMVQAHVIRMTKPYNPETDAVPHYHDVEFQMVYVLKGWFMSEFEGEGVHTFYAGSCCIQPPKIKHTVRGYSDDCELLEIVLPADFETVTLVD
jgi:mannose-6-phosphate isomerase-like protein (cupin superfamily)